MPPTLPEQGSESFVPLLLQHLLSHPSLTRWNLNPTLFAIVLLNLLAGGQGIIVDVLNSEPDSADINKIVRVVEAMFESIWGLRTCHLHFTPTTSPFEITDHLLHSHKDGSTTPSLYPTRQSDNPHETGGSTAKSKDNHFSRKPSMASSNYLSARESMTVTPGDNGVKPTSGLTNSPSGLGERLNTLEKDRDRGKSQRREEEMPDVLIVSGLEGASSAAQIRLFDIVRSKMIGEVALPQEFMVVWVRDEDESEKLPSWVIDNFSCSISVRADEVGEPPLDLRREAIIPRDYIKALSSLIPYTHLHPPLQTHISNLLSAVSTHPRLKTTITAQTITSFPLFVKAHRLLSSPFRLAEGWEQHVVPVSSIRDEPGAKFGLGGGRGGVDLWGEIAGEEPDIRILSTKLVSATSSINVSGKSSVESGDGFDGNAEEEAEMTQDLYATSENVQAVFATALRHRVRYRQERNEVMWLLKGSAAGKLDAAPASATIGEQQQTPAEERVKMMSFDNSSPRMMERKEKSLNRKRRAEVDGILDKILDTV